ncbi:hypothetical protein FDK38_001790 [Candidozyma auris]|nr:hypothetical protein FDK38_001790 [[Candida] auris]
MATPYKYLLNTENYGPICDLVKQISAKIEENETILSKVTRSLDSQLELPLLPGEEPQSPQDSQQHSDSLRTLIDTKYKAENDSAAKFDDVQDPRLRQLLVDTESLAQLHRAKVERNRQLFKIHQDYDDLIRLVVLPELTRRVCEYNMKTLGDMKENKLHEKLALDGQVWDKYQQYVANLDRIYAIVEAMTRVLQTVVEGKENERLEQQLLIVERLTVAARQRHKALARPPVRVEH